MPYGDVWNYHVNNKYGLNTRIPRGTSLYSRGEDIPAVQHTGRVINVPSGMPTRELDVLCAKLADCGVLLFDFDAIYNTKYWGIDNFRSLVEYIYPCVRKHGADVFESKGRWANRNSHGGTPITCFERLARSPIKPTPHDDHFDAAASIAHIQAILNKETTVSNEAPKFDDQTGAPLPKAYESRILTGEELVVGRQYRLEVVGGNNPPEAAAAGSIVVAIGDANGEYEGWVRTTDGTERTFEVDHRDLFLKN